MTSDESDEAIAKAWNEQIRKRAEERRTEIRELEDRWILCLLRGNVVDRVDWFGDRVELILGPQDHLIVLPDGSEAATRHYVADKRYRRPISAWARAEFEELASSEIVSAVAFKRGVLGIGLRNGGHLYSSSDDSQGIAAVHSGGRVLRGKGGLSTDNPYRLIRRTPEPASRERGAASESCRCPTSEMRGVSDSR